MNIPLGLPIRPDALNEIVNDDYGDFIFPIGTTSGIETDHLHSDRFHLFEDYMNDGVVDDFFSLVDANDEISMLYGGGFRDGGGAGVYFLQWENAETTSRPDIGTRCVHHIKDSYYPE